MPATFSCHSVDSFSPTSLVVYIHLQTLSVRFFHSLSHFLLRPLDTFFAMVFATADIGFKLDVPDIQNTFLEDPVMISVLERYLPENVLHEIKP